MNIITLCIELAQMLLVLKEIYAYFKGTQVEPEKETEMTEEQPPDKTEERPPEETEDEVPISEDEEGEKPTLLQL